MMQSLSDTVICFDLDDTLCKEIDYLKSAYQEISTKVGHPDAFSLMMDWHYQGENVFKNLIDMFELGVTIADCLDLYRNHIPHLSFADPETREMLFQMKDFGAKLGIISDGRSITQRNKIKAIGLEDFFDIVVISEELGSEKPSLRNFQVVMEQFSEREKFVYVGDNPDKDFLAPNQLGWRTYCLKDDGRNIHKQDFDIPQMLKPQYVIDSLGEMFY